MEDFPSESANEEDKPFSRNQLSVRGAFKRTWFQRQKLSESAWREQIDKDATEEDEDTSTEKKKDSRSARLFERARRFIKSGFDGIFKDTLAIEPLPLAKSVSDSENNTRTGVEQGQFSQVNTAHSLANTEAGDRAVISNEDQTGDSRPDDELAAPANVSETSDSGASDTTLYIERPVEQLNEQDTTLSPESSYDYTIQKRPEALITHQELTRKRREAQLRRDVADLKRRAQNVESEQREVERQERSFGRKLEEQQKAYEKLNKITLPKLEEARVKLRSRIEMQPPKKVVNANLGPITLSPKEVKFETAPAQLVMSKVETDKIKKITSNPEKFAPATIQQTVEQAAEQNIAIENIYEHRHEVKDEKTQPHFSGRSYNGQQGTGHPQPPLPQHLKAPSLDAALPQKEQVAALYDSNQATLYKKAMKNGFWAAIALLTLVGLLWLLAH